jgi:hypothetical protein
MAHRRRGTLTTLETALAPLRRAEGHKYAGVKLAYRRRLRRKRQARAAIRFLVAAVVWVILVNLLTAIHFFIVAVERD